MCMWMHICTDMYSYIDICIYKDMCIQPSIYIHIFVCKCISHLCIYIGIEVCNSI
jgi:hypothetical protein